MEGYEERPSDALWGRIIHKSSRGGMWIVSGMTAAAALLAGAFLTVRQTTLMPEADTVAEVQVNVNDSVRLRPEGDVRKDIEIEDAAPELPKVIRHAGEHRKKTEAWACSGTGDIGLVRNLPAAGREDGLAMEQDMADDSAELTEETDAQHGIPEEDFQNMAPERTSADNREKVSSGEKYEAGSDIGMDTERERHAWAAIMDEERRGHLHRGRFSAGISAAGTGGDNVAESRPTNGLLGANPLESGVGNADFMDDKFMKYNSLLVYNSPEVKTKYSHKVPVKIGVSARYDFGNGLGVESGVVYSLLSSDITVGETGSDAGWSKGEQTLHYIGIPLDLTYSFVGSRFLDVYVSCGGMLEKSVKGYLETDEFLGGRKVSSHRSPMTPKELQWSVNAAAGLQVNILEDFGLFVEPGVAYRFRSGSDIRSAYTDKPCAFSLGFGLRVTFR